MHSPLLFATAGLQPFDYLIVFAYMAGMLAIGWYLSRRQETVEEFFVAGRTMPWLATGMSMIATLMSTITYLGMPGELIKHGIGIATGLIAMPFVFLIVGFIWVPFFMRLRLTSAYEYLQRRFGTATRMLVVVLYLYMRFVWMGMIVFTASRAVAQMTQDTAPRALASMTGGMIELNEKGWFYFVLISTGIVSTLYTTLGGIKAVIWTDVIQFLILFAGAIATIVVVAWQTDTGPGVWWRDATSVYHERPPLASWDLGERVTVLWIVLNVLSWHVCTHASDQVALQRYFATRSASAARRTAAVNYVLDASMVVLLSLVGMALLTYYLRRPDDLPAGIADPRAGSFADRIFPHFIAHGMPVGLSGLVVAGVFAVAQSSIDSGINSTATVITVDLIRKFRSQPLGGPAELRLARWLTLGIGVVITAAGLAVKLIPEERFNIIDLTLKSFNCVLGPMGAIFMAGILFRHVGERAVLCGGLVGMASGFYFGYADLIPDWWAPSPFLVIPLSWLVTMVLAVLMGALLPRPRDEQVHGLTWHIIGQSENEAR